MCCYSMEIPGFIASGKKWQKNKGGLKQNGLSKYKRLCDAIISGLAYAGYSVWTHTHSKNGSWFLWRRFVHYNGQNLSGNIDRMEGNEISLNGLNIMFSLAKNRCKRIHNTSGRCQLFSGRRIIGRSSTVNADIYWILWKNGKLERCNEDKASSENKHNCYLLSWYHDDAENTWESSGTNVAWNTDEKRD